MTLNNESDAAGHALPTHTDTPYRTPSGGLSRHSSQDPSSLPGPSSSPPQFSKEDDRHADGFQSNKDTSNDETISILDPRRFTPTLHASLVSEILALRREIGSQNSLVENLEENLHQARIENESLNDSLKSSAKQTRSIKRQMQLLEGGTLSALGNLAKERDEAVETLADARKRLEASQKQIRSQEEDSERIQAFWDRDRQLWDTERRNLDTKVHIVEGRLKAVLAEIAAGQVNGHHNPDADDEAEDRYRYTHIRRESDTTSNRSNSMEGRRWSNGIRKGMSRSSTPNGLTRYGSTKLNGISLAEELELEEEAGNAIDESDDDAGDASLRGILVESQLRSRPFSTMSLRQDQKARKVLGLPTEDPEHLVDGHIAEPEEELYAGHDMDVLEQATPALQYTDTATQYSPPPSPKLQVTPSREKLNEQPPPVAAEHAANQRRKRVSMQTPLDKSPAITPLAMIPADSHTTEEPVSPPWTPSLRETTHGPSAPVIPPIIEMKSISTQTAGDEESLSSTANAPTRNDPASTTTVPTIAIHPPVPGPHSRQRSVVLPPHTRNVGCQTSIRLPAISRSISVQTEEIRVDKRPVKLPPNLLPSAVSSTPPLRSPGSTRLDQAQRPPTPPAQFLPTSPPSRDPPPPPEQDLSAGTGDAYPGNNDNGPLARGSSSQLRRPVRTGSLFAGFDVAGDERHGASEKLDLSDDDLSRRQPIRKTLSKVQNSWKLIPQTEANPLLSHQDPTPTIELDNRATSSVPEQTAPNNTQRALGNTTTVQAATQPRTFEGPPKLGNLVKEPDIRRTALISSGTAAHSQGSRSPNLPSPAGTDPPPFPVPTRSSSRQPHGSSDGADSPTPYVTSFLGDQRRQSERPSTKQPTFHTIRSAGVVPDSGEPGRQDSHSRSPRPMSSPPAAPDSPQLPPPLPTDDITSRYPPGSQRFRRHHQRSSKESNAATTSATSTVEPTSVIDAIAQTMVGEWMWKYVRRRKSFGMPDSPQTQFEAGRNNVDNMTGNGARHKRWVWLAPYERAVMWSSKQRTSGSALLGKGGRKLAIQSVLDVKDDTPLPKNAGPHVMFGRSILVLTPQRALKFTATSRDRHYVWLTALSFLSHSSLGLHDLTTTLPPMSQDQYRPASHQQQPRTTVRRNPIRDSIRIAKAKAGPAVDHANSSPIGGLHNREAIHELDNYCSTHILNDSEPDAAAAPHIPRFSGHARQRSSTGPARIPSTNNAFRGFSNHNLTVPPVSYAPSASSSINSATLADAFAHSLLDVGQGPSGMMRLASEINGVEMSAAAAAANFFEAVGTVRMEAFVEGSGEGTKGKGKGEEAGREEFVRKQRSSKGTGSLHTGRGRRKDLRYWGNEVPGTAVEEGSGEVGRVQGGGSIEMGTGWEEVDDPFKGF